MSKKAVGDVRPSQVLSTFGPGAIVDLQGISIIVAGADSWPTDEEDTIHERRLERALGVKRFVQPKQAEGSFFSRNGTVPAHVFPRYQVCPACRTLACLGDDVLEYEAKWGEIKCKAPGCRGRGRFRATTLPAPFVVSCPSGHIDDFPWREYAHRGPTSCNRRMSLVTVSRTGTIADIWVKCACEQGTRSVSDAFGENRQQALGPCQRARPWLGPNNRDTAACRHADQVRAMQRGATNVWFPVVRSALSVKESATPIGLAIDKCNPKQVEKLTSFEKLKMYVEDGLFPSLEPFSVEEVWLAIQKMRGEVETDDVELRLPEWAAFRNPAGAANDKDEFFLQPGQVPSQVSSLIESVVLARKLLEVRALIGFTRIDNAGVGTEDAGKPTIAPIFKNRPDWFPGVEVRGEGIFIELKEGAVASWESLPAVKARADAMAQKFRQWETERGGAVSPFPGARFVLLHTLAHAIIRQLSLDCGYSASSVRERIYSSTDPKRKMAGILLYTASPDSEGSLGGLVDLGSPGRFPELLMNALKSTARCSSDPLCADHHPDAHATINGAACHACVLASETSCETFNRFLDRNVLVATMAGDQLAYFHGIVP